MLKCPFCLFDNWEHAFFCNQCKADISLMSSIASDFPEYLTEAEWLVCAEPEKMRRFLLYGARKRGARKRDADIYRFLFSPRWCGSSRLARSDT